MIGRLHGAKLPRRQTVTLRPRHNRDPTGAKVADIQACYQLWRSRGADFITEPTDKYGETRCYIRDPDGYIIEVGQSKPDFTYG
jgi:catechol 2,3-dioxygenase-like lactoylglutathione lyase family enzyme